MQLMAIRYSIVIPVYRNADSLRELVEAVANLAAQLDGPMETVFVVDGSPDQSFELLLALLPEKSMAVRVLDLSRNFGSFVAIRQGLAEATGEFFAVMAADLQEPIELPLMFFRLLADDQCDIAYGVREERKDPLLSRLLSGGYWAFYRRFVQSEMPRGGFDIFGCNLKVRDELLAMAEANSSLVGQVIWMGFRRKGVPYARRKRPHGKSAWTFRKKLNYMLDSCFSFSDLPIRLLFAIGLGALLVALVYGTIVLVARITGLISEPGYATTVLLVSGFGALNALGLAVVGGYAWRTFENSKGRPLGIVARRHLFAGRPQP
jgi:glycosyltransferase involved in cell wall biosynthesis